MVSPATAELTALGTTVQLTAEVRDQNDRVMAGVTVTWSSSQMSGATVSASGLVTGVAEGTATITARAGSGEGTAEITVMDSDRAALVALYEATDGPNWVDNGNWLTDAPLGEWYGVDTDASGRVVRLELSGSRDLFAPGQPVEAHGLSGPIPDELGHLGSLMVLDLGYNDLSGAIPPSLGELANLTELWLHDNDLSDSIPPEPRWEEHILLCNNILAYFPSRRVPLQICRYDREFVRPNGRSVDLAVRSGRGLPPAPREARRTG